MLAICSVSKKKLRLLFSRDNMKKLQQQPAKSELTMNDSLEISREIIIKRAVRKKNAYNISLKNYRLHNIESKTTITMKLLIRKFFKQP